MFTLVDYVTREARSVAVRDVTGFTLAAAIAGEVDIKTSQLWTDEHKGYTPVGAEFYEHHTVNHSAGQYRHRGSTTNAVEGYFSQLTRSIDGTHHPVSSVHRDRYPAQFDFLYTHCRATDSARMRVLVGQVGGKRLTYKQLTAQA